MDFYDASAPMTEDQRFDMFRFKVGPSPEHRQMNESEFSDELEELWGSFGVLTGLITGLAEERRRPGLPTLLPHWASDEGTRELANNFPRHPSQPGFDPTDTRHRRTNPEAY